MNIFRRVRTTSSSSADLLNTTMSISKMRFMLRAEPSPSDFRTTVVNVIWIQPLDDSDEPEDPKFAFPDEYKAVSHHEHLFALTIAANAKRDLSPRWAQRIFKISLPAKVAELYIDEDGNPTFMSKMLNVFDPSSLIQPPPKSTSRSPTSSDNPPERSLSSITKDAVISKFNPKNGTNAEAWLKIFEAECARLGIAQDRFWEVIRLFVEEGAEKWYSTMRTFHDTTAWNLWRESFIDNFGICGLSSARKAIEYKYFSGSLSDYCQNKLSLLAGFNPKMDEDTRLALIALGLPIHLQNRINLAECSTVGKLITLINTFDKPRSFSSSFASNSTPNAFASLHSRLPRTPISLSPCPYCKKLGFERNHFEKDCYTKKRDQRNSNVNKNNNVNSNNPYKSFNNLEIDEQLRQEISDEQKN